VAAETKDRHTGSKDLVLGDGAIGAGIARRQRELARGLAPDRQVRREGHGKQSGPKSVGQEDRNSGCDAGIGPHRKAGSEDEVLDSTVNRVQVRCQLEEKSGCQGSAGNSMHDPFRVQHGLLGAVSALQRKWCRRVKAGKKTQAFYVL
jgi:hypothetical protein